MTQVERHSLLHEEALFRLLDTPLYADNCVQGGR